MDNTYVSKDDGLTWTKRVGNSLTRSVYGGKFVDVGTSLSLITKRNQRTDGSSISPDVITIGHEGATTVIDNLVARNVNVSTIGYGPSNTLSIAGNVNVSMGSPTKVLSFTPTSIQNTTITNTRIAYGNGKFVLVGYQSQIYHSSNGTTWTQVTSPTLTAGVLTILYVNDKFMIITESNPTIIYTSTDGAIWNPLTIGTQPNSYMYSVAYGNNSLVGITPDTGNIHVSTSTPLGNIWSSFTIAGLLFFITAFGTMSTATHGTNVFIVAGKNNAIRRNEGTASGTWSAPTTVPSISGNWVQSGFGNDTFMLTSSDLPGLLTISRDAGKTWSTPINFGIGLTQPIYVDGEWYIGSESGFMMISKNNGVTWDKRDITGIKINRFAYGDEVLVGVSNKTTCLIGIKKTKDDGSLITSDAITIGAPLTLGYYPWLITNSSMIGYTVEDTINATTLTNGNQFAFTTDVTLPAGVWFINPSLRIYGGSSVVTEQNYAISIIGTNLAYGQYLFVGSLTVTGLSYTASAVVVSNGATSYNIQLYIVYSGPALIIWPSSNSSGSIVRRTRIA